ncbi:hypothetical protein LMG26690_02847 [Achromobacter animicus]|uniref:Uncharacterized protein n=1 Tax=Achromobacter animicus TaxID=1389935 RepID=A0A6S6ZZB3_9BURK|nr:hypothetical protein LMG26690_02847 [Achromobacter animicus]
MDQSACAGDGPAQSLENAVQAGRSTRQRAAQVRDRAAQAGQQVGDRCAQLRRVAHLLSQAHDVGGQRAGGGVERAAHACQCRLQAQRQHVVDGLADIAQRGLEQRRGRAVEHSARHASHDLRNRLQQTALASQRAGQRAHRAGGIAQHRRQGIGIVRVRMQQAARAGHRLAQTIHQPAHANRQAAGQARALDVRAQVADRASHLPDDAVKGLAQAGRGAHLLRQPDHGVRDRLDGGVQRLAHAAKGRVQVQRQGVVDCAAGVAQRRFQHADDAGRVGAGIGAATAGIGAASRVGATTGVGAPAGVRTAARVGASPGVRSTAGVHAGIQAASAGVGRDIGSWETCGFLPAAAVSSAGAQCAYKRGGQDGGGEDAMEAALFGMDLHDELLWLEESGPETTRYAS